nr:metal ABC transporter ATP-binding protein [Pseudovibrio flavus]
MIELEGVGVERQGRWLIRNVDLQIDRGKIVTLIGPNGAGKSTLAKAALGVMPVSEGRVKRSSGLTVGYVPQKLAIDWTMPLTVERLMSLTGSPKKGEVEEALEMVGIPHLKHSGVQQLSGGEFQRALLARAYLRKPDLLVLDEPVQGVDFSGEIALYELIGRIRDQLNCGILLISHDLHIVMAQTDTVICLNGHVCCRGRPEEVAVSPEFQNLFGTLGAPIGIYRHHHDHSHLPDGRVMRSDGSVHDNCCGCGDEEGEGHSHNHDHDHGHHHNHNQGDRA